MEISAIEGRVGQEIRNDIIFELTGGDGIRPARRSSRHDDLDPHAQSIVDPVTGVAPLDIVALTVSYRLVNVATNKLLLTDSALARVTVDRSLQRFARARGVRDAENRAAKTVAQQIRSRLATYFLTRPEGALAVGR